MKPTLVDLEMDLARHGVQVLLAKEHARRVQRIERMEAEVERLAKEARAMLTRGRARRAVDRLVACNPTEAIR